MCTTNVQEGAPPSFWKLVWFCRGTPLLLGLWHFPCTQITHGSKQRCNQTATKSGKFKNCIQYIQSEYYVALIFSTLGVKF